MSKFTEYIGSQFGNPRGIIGKICCVIMNVINKAMYKRALAIVSISKDANTLDIGYGNGYFMQQLFKKYQPNMFGIDISEDMKMQAVKRNKRANEKGKLHLELGDCCALPYADEFFEVVTSINTIYFWNDTIMGLKEIHRTLQTEGIFLNVVYTKEWLQKLSYTKNVFKFFDKKEFKELGKVAGFSEVSIQEIVKNKSFIVIYKK